MSEVTEADVEAVVRICRMYAPSAESDVYPMADQILAAVVPAMRDRWLNELIESLPGNPVAWHRTCDIRAWLELERSGGDQ